MVEKQLLTQGEAAQVLGVGPQAIRAAIDSGTLRTVILGKRRLIPRSALDELLRGQ